MPVAIDTGIGAVWRAAVPDCGVELRWPGWLSAAPPSTPVRRCPRASADTKVRANPRGGRALIHRRPSALMWSAVTGAAEELWGRPAAK